MGDGSFRAEVRGFGTKGLENMPNEGRVEVGAADITCDLVDGRLQSIEGILGSGVFETRERLCGGDQKPGAIVAEAGSMVGTAETVIGAGLERFHDGSLAGLLSSGVVQVEVGVEGACDKENPSTDYATSHDLLGGHVQTEVVEIGSVAGSAKEPDAVVIGGIETEGLEVEPNSEGVRIEAAEICNGTEHTEDAVFCPDKNRSSVNHVMGHDLLDEHCQATDNGQNQAEVVVHFTAGPENINAGRSLGMNPDEDAQAMVGEIEVGCRSMVDGYQDKYHEASLSQTFLVDTDRSIWRGGKLVPREEMQKVESMPPAVEVQNQDLLPIDKNLMDIGDLVTPGSDIVTTVPVVEAGSGDGYLVNDDLMGTGEFVTTNVSSAEVAVNIKVQSADTHLVDENAMDKGDIFLADVGSVVVVPVVESQSRDTHLIDENNNDNGDLVMDNSCLAVETPTAVTCLLDENLMEKGDFVVEDSIPVVKISVPETSELSEIQTLASHGNESFDSPLGDNQEIGASSVGSLADGGPGANAHEVEPSPGRDRMDVESNVLTEGFHAPDEREVEFVQNFEAKQLTPAPRDSMMDVIMDAGTMEIGEHELLERSEKQTLQHVTVTPWTLYVENNQRARYNLPSQYTAKFSVSDLVWGKVKSHPWWPGQIFDHSDASKLALKHQRKDNFLIAYFGDRTFAWREKSQLKPFYTNFSQMEKQSSSDAFIYAVNDVLGEASRRMELGMTCSCLPEEDYADIKYQNVENAGIREGVNNSFFDTSLIMNYFQPARLLEYIKALAQMPTGGADRLELVIAKAQLKAFYCSKGYPELPGFIFGGGLMENDFEISPSCDKKPIEVAVELSTPTSELIPGKRKRGRPPKKQKHILEDGRKQKNLSELMEEKNVSLLANGGKSGSGMKAAVLSNSCSSGRKRKIGDSDPADSGKNKKKRLNSLGDLETKSRSPTFGRSFQAGECIDDSRERKKKRWDLLGDLETKSPSPTLNSSFKVGEYIRRVARQLTGSPPIPKCHDETFQKCVSKDDHRGGDVISTDAFTCTPVPKRRTKKGFSKDYSSPDEMLSQLCLAASDPLRGYNFLSMIVSFFTDFRNYCSSSSSEGGKHSEKMGGKRGRKKAVKSESASSDMSTPDHMKDSDWSDMISHNSSGKGLLSNGLKRKGEVDMRKQRKKRKSAGQPSPTRLLGPVMDTAQQLQLGTLSPNMKPASVAERSIISVEEKIVDTPTALILSFNSSDSLPSEADLIRIFGRYGPLREAETEVLMKTNRVKVVFKRRADAEIAFSSAGKFSIFGPALVSYRLKYFLSASKTSPDTSPQGKNHAASIESGSLEVSENGVVSDTALVEAVGKG